MSGAAGVVVLIGRIVFAFFFGAVAGVCHFKRDQMMRGYAEQAGFPVPAIAGWVAGLWLILGALSVAAGIWPDVGSLMIGAFVIPAALFFHRFWTLENETQRTTQTQPLLQKPDCSRSGARVLRNLRHLGIRAALHDHGSVVRLLEAQMCGCGIEPQPGREPATRGGRRWGT